jgi:predicted ATPase/transcriptional regulator with XRE-family HTH domain/Flp pilus assembly protein TadD
LNEGTAFGLWLKQRRKDSGLTQKELAERVECSAVTIEKIESGERKPSSQIALLLAEHLNVPTDEHQAFVEFSRADIPSSHLANLAQGNGRSPWRTLHGISTNLPTPPTAFIGREDVVEAACAALRGPSVRLLVLTGPPGIGKTRLALQVAGALGVDFEDGVFFVGLAPVSDPGLVAPSIAATLGVREMGRGSAPPPPKGPGSDTPKRGSVGQEATPASEYLRHEDVTLQSLKRYLRDKRILLVLDNFEQVMAAAPMVTELLAAAPWVKALVTSREVLHVYGEHDFPVPPLKLPQGRYRGQVEHLMQYEAVRLFVERAWAARPEFALTDENAQAVLEICVRLDRLPLTIELAAARIRTLSPQEILDRLENSLELLMGGARDLPVRQRALRSAIDWSYDLLNREERAMLRRMAVFAGGCAREAAEEVLSPGESGVEAGDLGSPRVLRTQLLRRVHAADLLEQLLDKSLLLQEEAHGEIRYSMLETVREYASEKLSQSGEVETLRWQHARYYLGFLEKAQGHLQGPQQVEWLERLEREHNNARAGLAFLLERGEAELALRLGSALWRFWQLHGHLTEGLRWLERALALAGEVTPRVRADALTAAGNLAWNYSDFDYARTMYQQSLEISRESGDRRGMARPLNNLAVLAHAQGDYGQAAELFEQSLALKRELGDRTGMASSLNGLGTVMQDWGHYPLAESMYEESLELYRELGDRHGIASALTNLGVNSVLLGNPDKAHTLYEEALALRRELGDKQGVSNVILNMGEAASYQGHYSAAAALYEQSLTMRRQMQDRHGLASSLRHLGITMYRLGRPRRAQGLLRQGLDLFVELGDRPSIAECLIGLAGVAGTSGQAEKAARLLGAADAILEALGFHLHIVDRIEYERDVAVARKALGEEAWTRAWEAGRALTAEAATTLARAGELEPAKR